MKSNNPLAVIVVVMLSVTSCKTDLASNQRRRIEGFSDSFFEMVKANDSLKYLALLPTKGDQLLDISKNSPSSLPMNEDALAINPREFVLQFDAVLVQLREKLGDISKSKLNRINYTIDNTPLKRSLGLFQFDIDLEVVGNKRTVHLLQRNCVATTRGVLVGDELRIRD